MRCDRLRPCNNCASRGQASSCAYRTEPPRMPGQSHDTSDAQDRIDQLERLVRSILKQTSPTSHSSPPGPHRAEPVASVTRRPTPSRPSGDNSARLDLICGDKSSPSESGALKVQGSGLKYMSSAHWAAVLDSIAELRDQFEQEDRFQAEEQEESSHSINPRSPGPHLLYAAWSPNITRVSILECLPPRPVVDRLVYRYFNTVVVASGFPHSAKFRREYDEFWETPEKAPITWVGLLFAMMCLSSQSQQLDTAPASIPTSLQRSPYASHGGETQHFTDVFRQGTVQCLMLGHYTNGGPCVLETLLLYLMSEFLPSKDSQVGIRLVVGIIVQIAMHMGYHRDSTHFPNITPFEGEMRRRIWALIYQIDFGTSTQLGLPRLLIRASQIDTAEPRNLVDSDFDEKSTDLPPPRPDTEVTPALYSSSKLRIFSVGVKVADLASETHCPPYADVLELDRQLDEARNSLPSSMKWTGLASCLTDSSQVILQKIFLEVCIHRIKITLHKRFQLQSDHSRRACLTAAMEVLKLQHLIDEETDVDGRLYQSRWSITSAFTHDFLLATSVLCFYIRAAVGSTHGEMEGLGTNHGSAREGSSSVPVDLDEVRALLRLSQAIWLRESASSKEAQRASEALCYVLDDLPPRTLHGAASSSGEHLLSPHPAFLLGALPTGHLYNGQALSSNTHTRTDFFDASDQFNLSGSLLEFNNDGFTWQMFGQNPNNEADVWAGFGAW